MAPKLTDRLEAARAEVARLERAVAQAKCSEVGHRWRLMGGRNCGCHEDACCSVPVHACSVCGDCDYGENEVSASIKQACPDREEFARASLATQEDA